MKKIALLFLLALPLCGCENKYVSDGRNMYEMYFDKFLKDPSSFKVYSEEYTIDGASVKWRLDYGAKNSFGSMEREQAEFETSPGYIFIDGNSYRKEDLK